MSDVGSVEAGNPEAEAPVAEAAPVAETVAAPASDAPFYSGFQNEELRSYAETKGFKGAEQVVSSYHNLEKMLGAEKAGRTVVLPGPDADEASMSDFYTKLGRPETADAYALPVPEGQDGSTAEWASGVFHKHGLTSAQAQGVAADWNAHTASMSGASEEANNQVVVAAEAELRREWGAAYDQKMTGMDSTASALGINTDHLLGLRSAMGPAAALRFVDQLASKLGEDMVVNGESAEGALTPASAVEAMNAMWGDPETSKALMDRGHPQHKAMLAKKSALAQQASAGRG